jgi:GntR family transcriptional regulator, transcriptional repressor for pyruvate dehydrogenase complex
MHVPPHELDQPDAPTRHEQDDPMERVVLNSAAKTTADVLREEILGRADGDTFLGSEDELLERLSISRPILRQAARLLEAEQLLTVKRGWNGGFYARKPTAEAAAHMAAVYLRSENATFADQWRVLDVIGAECARLAAQNPDAEAREALVTFVEENEQVGDSPADRRRFAKARIEFYVRIARLTQSPTLNLFSAVLWDVVRTPAATQVFMEPEHVELVRRYHRLIARDIARGNARAAAANFHRFSEIALTQFDASLKDSIGGQPG